MVNSSLGCDNGNERKLYRRSAERVADGERDQAYDRQRDQIRGHQYLPSENKDAADRGRRDRFRREPYPSDSQGTAAAVATTATPRTGPFARAGQYCDWDNTSRVVVTTAGRR